MVKCKICKKKLKLTETVVKKCACGVNLCFRHRAPWDHHCRVNTPELIKLKHKKFLRGKLTKPARSTIII